MFGNWGPEKRRDSMALLLLLGLVATTEGQNWPRFRGPNGQGLSDAKTIPVTWSEQDYRWKVTLPGKGHSSPVIWGDRLFVTCGDEKAVRGTVLCLRAGDGRELWRKTYDFSRYRFNSLNSFASSTPAVDSDGLYVLWPGADETTVAALTHSGDPIWAVKLPGVEARHGAGSSPIVAGECVIVSHEQDKGGGETPSLWLALGRRDGAIRWKYEHPENANASYSTPCLFEDGQGREQLVFTSNLHGIAAMQPGTGKLLWQVPTALPARVVSSPVICGDRIIGTCGQGGRGVRLAAVTVSGRASAKGDEVYGLDRGVTPYVPTSVVHDAWLFAFHDQGTVSCLRGRTGEVIWSEKPAGRYYGSPVCVDGRLYCITVDGQVVVLEAGPTYKRLAVNPLGEKSHATPAVGAGRMYLRTFSHLVCIGGENQH